MRTDLRTISTDATIADAVDALIDGHVSALPVIDRYGRAVGIVSTREILKAETESRSSSARVLEIMVPWPLTIGPEVDVRVAAQEMLYLNQQRLFVEYEGALVGVISQTDVVGAVANAKV
jgi:CBS domain-containing protein